jgi:hypothetical protein
VTPRLTLRIARGLYPLFTLVRTLWQNKDGLAAHKSPFLEEACDVRRESPGKSRLPSLRARGLGHSTKVPDQWRTRAEPPCPSSRLSFSSWPTNVPSQDQKPTPESVRHLALLSHSTRREALSSTPSVASRNGHDASGQETPQTLGTKGIHARLLAPLGGGRLLAYQGSLEKAQAPDSNNDVTEWLRHCQPPPT